MNGKATVESWGRLGQGQNRFDGKTYRELDGTVRRVGAPLDSGAVHPRRSARDHLRMIARGAGLPACPRR